jgi:hypothetical protein
MFRQTPPQLLVFELWYGDELVAADFGHPVYHGMLYYEHMYELSLQQVPHTILLLLLSVITS